MPGGWEASTSQHPVMLIDDGRDVKVLVGVDAADDAAARYLLILLHACSPGSTACGRLHRDRMPGQDSNVTERQALLGSRAPARQNPAARHPGRPTGPGKDTDRGRSEWGSDRAEMPRGTSHPSRSIAVRVRPPRNGPGTASQSILTVALLSPWLSFWPTCRSRSSLRTGRTTSAVCATAWGSLAPACAFGSAARSCSFPSNLPVRHRRRITPCLMRAL